MKTRLVFLFIFMTAMTIFPTNLSSFQKIHLDHKDGLGSNYIRWIGQDNHGYIWVVTGTGLSRFNGTDFETFNTNNSGLNSDELNCIIADPQNPDKVWIGSRYDGLYTYDYNTGKITQYSGKLHTNDVPHLSISSDNKIWVTHYHKPPEKLDPSTGETERLFWKAPKNFALPIWCMAEDKAGKFIYIGHENEGMTVVDLKTKKFKNYKHNPLDEKSIGGNTVYSIYVDKDNYIWVGTENGISIFNPRSENFISFTHADYPNSILPGAVRSITNMDSEEIWIATSQGGISVFEGDSFSGGNIKFTNITPDTKGNPQETLYSSSPYVLFKDSFGNKWIGYQSDGIDVAGYDPPFVRQMPVLGQSINNQTRPTVWSMTTDRKGNVWMAGEREIAIINGNKIERIPLPKNTFYANTPVKALYADSKNNLWIGTYNSGAYIMNLKDRNISKINSIDREICCFLEEDNSDMLIGTHKGLYRMNNRKVATLEEDINNKLKDRYVTCIHKDKSGNLLIGTFGKGITIVYNQSNDTSNLNVLKGMPSNTINSIFEDSKGNIWIATRGGVVKTSSKNYDDFKIYPISNGYSINIKSIEEDNYGKIWMSSEDGITCYDPATDSISTYTRSHKAPLTAFLEGSSCKGEDGTLFFGSLDGIAQFNPASVKDYPYKKGEIRVNSILAHDNDSDDHNKVISIPVNSDVVTLPHNYNTFTLKFNYVDVTKAINTELRYNMQGVNDVWSETGDSNEAVYRNLKPGTYRFQVSSRTFGGEWSQPEILITIKIEPPIYLTWWAITLYIAISVLLIYIAIHFYKSKLNLEKDLAIEKENNKNNNILNEERLVFFTNITHELRTPLSLIIGPIEDLINDPELKDKHRSRLQVIRGSSMRLLNLINGILEFRKTETRNRRLEVVSGNLANFVREIGLRFKELNSNKNLNISIDVSDMENVEMYYDPEMITTMLNNLLGNAIKYTRKGDITLSLKPKEIDGINYVDLSVKDTGEGIAPEELPHIFKRYYQAKHNKKIAGTGIGLALTKNLVDLHAATIRVESEKGKGSIFTIRFVRDNSYPSALHKEVTETIEAETETKNTEISATPEHLTLLIVEDDEDVRDYIANAFASTYNVVCAENGKEGLEKVRETLPDIVVSDIMMPEMDGIELCNAIKSDMATSHIPVILLTAKDSMLDKEEGYNSGADSYMTKPFSAKLLQARINNILDTRHRLSMKFIMHSEDNSVSPTNYEETPDATEQQETGSIQLSTLDKEFIARLHKLVEDNIEIEDMDMPFLTDKMCMSHSTLYRKVKSITGLTPVEFTRKIKLNKAKQLLMSEEVDPAEIPFLTGFNSSAYFRRVFKKEFGVTPKEMLQEKKDNRNQNITN